jgi:BON domain
MRNQLGLGVLGTAGLGAGLMFLLDPDMGTRRRAILRDKLISLMRLTAGAADKTSRDVKNRLYGTMHTTKSLFGDTAVSDDVLVERVRSQMGRAVSHPHAIHVTAENGWVTLTGEILSDEINDLIRTVSGVKGVTEVVDRLTAYNQPGDISGLQGGHTRRGSRFALLQSNWPPAIRLTVGMAGLITTATGIKQGGILGSILGGIGAGMVLLAITNQNVRQMMGRASTIAEERGTTIPFPTRQRMAL